MPFNRCFMLRYGLVIVVDVVCSSDFEEKAAE
jgi:hypothetical protein